MEGDGAGLSTRLSADVCRTLGTPPDERGRPAEADRPLPDLSALEPLEDLPEVEKRPLLKVSAGLAFFASVSAWAGHHTPAAGSTLPYSGSIVPPAMPRLHWPSDSPMVFTYRYASTRATPVSAVGRTPTPRLGGLHHVCGSPVYLPATRRRGATRRAAASASVRRRTPVSPWSTRTCT